MPTLEPPRTERYGPPQSPGIHPEAGGFTAICTCGSIRWNADRGVAAAALATHGKKCKGGGGK